MQAQETNYGGRRALGSQKGKGEAPWWEGEERGASQEGPLVLYSQNTGASVVCKHQNRLSTHLDGILSQELYLPT